MNAAAADALVVDLWHQHRGLLIAAHPDLSPDDERGLRSAFCLALYQIARMPLQDAHPVALAALRLSKRPADAPLARPSTTRKDH